jgi:superfamily II DNA or RNA helicase
VNDINLYDYQTQAVEALRDNIKKGVNRQVLCAPTGSGKTVMAAYLLKAAEAKGSRAFFLCDRVALINQTSAVLDDYGIDHGVIQANHWRRKPDQLVQVASQQTLDRRGWPVDVDLIVVDECHTMREQTVKQIQKTSAVVLGLTATPFTAGMGKVYEDVVSVTTTNRLIDEGRLAPFTIYAPAPIDMEGAAVDSRGEWTHEAAAERAMRVVGDVVENYLKYAMGRKFIAFGATIKHCEQMQRELMNAGIRCELYTSHTSDNEREAILDEYRKPDSSIRGLISVAALAKGFDVPDVSCLIIARPLRSSFAEHIQIVGRGLRSDKANPDKKCVIIDHAENCLRFGPRMADFFENSVSAFEDDKKKAKKLAVYDYYSTYEEGDKVRHLGKQYVAIRDVGFGEVPGVHPAWELVMGETPWIKCYECDHVHPRSPSCPMCGHEYAQRYNLHEEGELTNIEFVAAHKAEQARWWAGILYIAREMKIQKDTGWSSHKFKDKFGIWPSPSIKAIPAKYPDPDVRRWMDGQKQRYLIAKRARGA